MENKEMLKQKGIEKRTKLRQMVLAVIGKTCYICGRDYRINFHKLDGQEHDQNLQYIICHDEEFVSLCRECHNVVHAFQRNNCNWERWEEVIKQIKSRNS